MSNKTTYQDSTTFDYREQFEGKNLLVFNKILKDTRVISAEFCSVSELLYYRSVLKNYLKTGEDKFNVIKGGAVECEFYRVYYK